jgi:hypothetical protein
MSMTLLERNGGILERIDRPGGLAGELEELFRRGKREQLLAGRDADGDPFAPLAASTLEHRDGSGGPLVPHGDGSRVLTLLRIEVTAEAGRLRVEQSWPGLGWIRWHMSGTRDMPRRDPGGFRAEDAAEGLRRLRGWVMHGR